ncbi:MAG: V-type ATP synthase subunit D [Solirubrobacteraceae bacterium]
MRVRSPPGRAGRPWLVHRLEVARRGAELLDEKYRALAREQRRLRPLLATAREQWELAAPEAARWQARAAVLGGERQFELLRAAATPASLEVGWRTVLGVRCPAEADLTAIPEPEQSVLGGSAALVAAAQAHRHALETAVQVAVLDGALGRIDTALHAVAVRRNAIQRRWIPAHEQALAALDLALEELEREDSARVRRLTTASGPASSWSAARDQSAVG